MRAFPFIFIKARASAVKIDRIHDDLQKQRIAGNTPEALPPRLAGNLCQSRWSAA